MQENIRFHRWHHRVKRPDVCVVFPDGCRDVLIIARPGRPIWVRLTDFDIRPRLVAMPAGVAITGYRLRPGAIIDLKVLSAIKENSAEAANILTSEIKASSETDAAVLALTRPNATVQSVSKELGVSVRTMQRHFRHMKLPPPDYWRLLARARRAAGKLFLPAPLAEVAADCGYSDQAHMTREFVRWFGRTPTQLRRDASLLDSLGQPALGNWTAEQISTRYPSGSLT